MHTISIRNLPPEGRAYRGYYLYPGLIGDWFVRREGFVIHCARSLADAKTAVDDLLGGAQECSICRRYHGTEVRHECE